MKQGNYTDTPFEEKSFKMWNGRSDKPEHNSMGTVLQGLIQSGQRDTINGLKQFR